MFIERRSSVRVPCELPSSFRNLDSNSDKTSRFATVKDISRGGVRIKVHDFIPVTNKLVFSLNLPKHRTIEVRLDPAWIAEESGTGKFNLGAKFVEMSEEGIAAVQHFHSHALVH